MVTKRRALLWLLLIWPYVANSHLLNMTDVSVTVLSDKQLHLVYDIDLSQQFENRQAYYESSLIKTPLQNPQIQALLSKLFSATEIYNDDTAIDATWRASQFQAETDSRGDYLNPLNWPKIHIEAYIQTAAPLNNVSILFRPTFAIEEPIATTLIAQNISQTRWLVAHQRSPQLSLSGLTLAGNEITEAPSLIALFRQGFRHILPYGADHIAFIVLISLLSASVRQAITVISLFTAAHAITLSLCLLGWVNSPVALIETLIAASIIWAAIDVIRLKKLKTQHYMLILIFGLVHGLGFASVINQQSLSSSNIILSLLYLNLGVEAGQLLVAATSFSLMHYLRAMQHIQLYVYRTIAALLATLSTYLLVSRLFILFNQDLI